MKTKLIRRTGHVHRWGASYGFIVFQDPNDGTQIVFGHSSQVRKVEGFERLLPYPGLEVSFAIIETKRGPMAVDISLDGLQFAGVDHE